MVVWELEEVQHDLPRVDLSDLKRFLAIPGEMLRLQAECADRAAVRHARNLARTQRRVDLRHRQRGTETLTLAW